MDMSNINLIPYPYLLKSNKGICNFEKSEIPVTGSFEQEKLCSINLLIEAFGFSFSPASEKSFNVPFVEINHINDDIFDSYDLTVPDSYYMKITESKVSIVSKSQSGLFYGFITLSQLLMEGGKVECCQIYDKPEYEWRGFLLDTCRTFFSAEFVKKIIRLCALHKMNKFHWHLTDDQGWRVNIEKYPLLTKIGSIRKANTNPESLVGDFDGVKFERYYYTDDEIKDVVEYAKNFNIEIIPEVEFPGHATALLASYPEYGCTKGPYSVETRWGIFDDVLCLGQDKIFDFFKAVLEKITKLFPGDYIHIGGDECPTVRWNKCPDCQKRIKELNLKNESQLQSWGTKKITDLVLSFGKKPIGWDEIIDNTDLIPLNKDVIVQSWRGIEGGEKASAQKHKVIMSPVEFCYLDHKPIASAEEPGRLGVVTLEKTYEFTPITKNMSKEASEYVLGGEATLWTEELGYSRHAEYMLLPRLCSLSESLWLSPENKNWTRFKGSVGEHRNKLEKLGYLCSL